MTITEIIELVRENVLLKGRIDELSSVQTSVKKDLKKGIEELGVEDDRGHVVVNLGQEVDGVTTVMQQRRVSKTLDTDIAESLLKEKGLYDRCVTTIEVLNEDEVMAAYYEGALTEADIDTMFPAKVSYALVMK
jgi:hypothetical protein